MLLAECLDNPVETQRLGEEFHMAVAEASHNKVLVSQLKAFRDVLWQPDNSPDAKEKARRILAGTQFNISNTLNVANKVRPARAWRNTCDSFAGSAR